MNFSRVVTVENHLADCGFGSWMAERLIGKGKQINKLKIVALKPDAIKDVGSEEYLTQLGGLNKNNLLEALGT